jgi:hypothetical protein
MIIAAPNQTTSGPPSTLNVVRHLGATGEMFGEFVNLGDEPAQIHDSPDPRVFRRVGDIGSGTVVGVAEVGLADAVHQVVDDVDRTVGERLLGRRFVARVQRDSGDLVMPTEVGQSVRVSGGGDDIVARDEQCTDEP